MVYVLVFPAGDLKQLFLPAAPAFESCPAVPRVFEEMLHHRNHYLQTLVCKWRLD